MNPHLMIIEALQRWTQLPNPARRDEYRQAQRIYVPTGIWLSLFDLTDPSYFTAEQRQLSNEERLQVQSTPLPRRPEITVFHDPIATQIRVE